MRCEKVQFFKEHISKEKVDLAHEHGILCNAFYADTIERAEEYFNMGVDCILTNDYQRMYNAFKDKLDTGCAIPTRAEK